MAKSGKPRQILNPFMLTLAVAAGWAALHEPQIFTIASAGVWVCGAITMGLLARAALALFAPLLNVLGVLFSRALKGMRYDGVEP